MEKFIFSTKYYGDPNIYVFSDEHRLDDNSKILDLVLNDETYFSQLVAKGLTQDLQSEIASELNIDPSKVTQNSVESKDDQKWSFIHKSKLPRFSYYKPDKNNNPNDNVCAVPCWKEPSVEWINALIEDEVLHGKLGTGDVLYLMLHDKDVPGYKDKTFEILTPDKLSKIRGIVGTLEGRGTEQEKWVSNGFEVRIIIFNHVDNAIVELLLKGFLKDGIISDKVIAIFANQAILKKMFKPSVSTALDYSGLDVDGFVDLCDNTFDVTCLGECIKQLPSKRRIYSYEDSNGALLTELMHVKADLRSSIQFAQFLEALRKPVLGSDPNDVKTWLFPIIIKTHLSFFKKWEDSLTDNDCDKKEKIHNHKNKKAMEDNLNRGFSFFNNSSIFIRLVDIDDNEAFEAAVEEFEYFDQIGLYDYNSAWENLEYNTRIQPQNYLESSAGGHGNFVTPVLYGNEKGYKTVLTENHVAPPSVGVVKKLDFKHMSHFHNMALRILLIDDKVGGGDSSDSKCFPQRVISIPSPKLGFNNTENPIELKKCESCGDTKRKKCKLHTIMRLMDAGQAGDGKGKIFDKIGELIDNTSKRKELTKDYFYWNEMEIEFFHCPTIFEDFIDDDQITDRYEEFNVYCEESEKKLGKKVLNIKCDFSKLRPTKESSHVQIVGVQDVRTALLLLSKFKFDMVFSDYLLDYKQADRRDQRDFANQFFKFLSREYEKEDGLSESRKTLLNKLRHNVLDNRGPLGKLWIMPITGFNQTFIQDLYRDGINLIDYRWNISNGADPITTPWQFLFHLNKFIELQLRMCVYKREQLLKFLMITCEDLKELEMKGKISFDDFKSFMGSEYATFTQLYGNRLTIRRDAFETGDQSDDKSVFATYIWKQFYANPRYYDVIELNRLAHKFYHQASTMYNDRVGRRRLNEAFDKLCFFVRTNGKISKIVEENADLKLLLSDNASECGLGYLRKLIAQCTRDDN